MKIFSFLFLIMCVSGFSCTMKNPKVDINHLAEKYVRLGLAIGEYDGDFVDAYYGPDSLKPTVVKAAVFPKDSFLNAVSMLKNELSDDIDKHDDTAVKRAKWMINQLTAFDRRIRNYSGEFTSFDEETLALFGVKAPDNLEAHFSELVKTLDSLLPGTGTIPERMQELSKKYIIPKDKIDTIFKTAYREARKRTLDHYTLPAEESFEFEFVTDKPWSGYNWYKGNYHSLIQQNLDLPIYIDRAIDLACHEGYPGHHVYNTLLEKNLYHDKGWIEISMYPLFSPQSLIAEGSANYGVHLTFPEEEMRSFVKEKLFPLADFDTTAADIYFNSLAIKEELNFARNEVARGFLNKTMDSTTAIHWLTEYSLVSMEQAVKSLSFIKKYRSYVINYNYGQQLVKNYIESRASTPDKKWEEFGKLLSNEVRTEELK